MKKIILNEESNKGLEQVIKNCDNLVSLDDLFADDMESLAVDEAEQSINLEEA